VASSLDGKNDFYLSFGAWKCFASERDISYTALALSLTDALLNTPTSAIAKDIITTDILRFHDQLPTKTPRHHLQKKKCLTSKQPSSKTPFVATFHFEIEGK
jgi:hypothetical protein